MAKVKFYELDRCKRLKTKERKINKELAKHGLEIELYKDQTGKFIYSLGSIKGRMTKRKNALANKIITKHLVGNCK